MESLFYIWELLFFRLKKIGKFLFQITHPALVGKILSDHEFRKRFNGTTALRGAPRTKPAAITVVRKNMSVCFSVRHSSEMFAA